MTIEWVGQIAHEGLLREVWIVVHKQASTRCLSVVRLLNLSLSCRLCAVCLVQRRSHTQPADSPLPCRMASRRWMPPVLHVDLSRPCPMELCPCFAACPCQLRRLCDNKHRWGTRRECRTYFKRSRSRHRCFAEILQLTACPLAPVSMLHRA
jgi:hypothetical protein